MEIAKCSCGAKPEIEFGFSCTFKPKATIYCKKCGKSVQKIGFENVNLFELWKKEVENEKGTEIPKGDYNEM